MTLLTGPIGVTVNRGSVCTHPEAEARLRLVLSQEFLRTRLADEDEEEDGGSGEVR